MNEFLYLAKVLIFLKLGAKNGLNLLKLGAKNKSNLLKLEAKNKSNLLKLGAKNGIKVLEYVFLKEITSKLFSFQSFFVFLHRQFK